MGARACAVPLRPHLCGARVTERKMDLLSKSLFIMHLALFKTPLKTTNKHNPETPAPRGPATQRSKGHGQVTCEVRRGRRWAGPRRGVRGPGRRASGGVSPGRWHPRSLRGGEGFGQPQRRRTLGDRPRWVKTRGRTRRTRTWRKPGRLEPSQGARASGQGRRGSRSGGPGSPRGLPPLPPGGGTWPVCALEGPRGPQPWGRAARGAKRARGSDRPEAGPAGLGRASPPRRSMGVCRGHALSPTASGPLLKSQNQNPGLFTLLGNTQQTVVPAIFQPTWQLWLLLQMPNPKKRANERS